MLKGASVELLRCDASNTITLGIARVICRYRGGADCLFMASRGSMEAPAVPVPDTEGCFEIKRVKMNILLDPQYLGDISIGVSDSLTETRGVFG